MSDQGAGAGGKVHSMKVSVETVEPTEAQKEAHRRMAESAGEITRPMSGPDNWVPALPASESKLRLVQETETKPVEPAAPPPILAAPFGDWDRRFRESMGAPASTEPVEAPAAHVAQKYAIEKVSQQQEQEKEEDMNAAALVVAGMWVLGIMTRAQPQSGWTKTYGETAEAIADAANEDPVFSGELGAYRTAALLTAIALHESSFRRDAIGDHGRSFGLYQVQPGTAKLEGGWEDVNMMDLQTPRVASKVAVALVRRSLRACHERPLDERLAWFAGGGPKCPDAETALRASRQIFGIARHLFSISPPTSSAKNFGEPKLVPVKSKAKE